MNWLQLTFDFFVPYPTSTLCILVIERVLIKLLLKHCCSCLLLSDPFCFLSLRSNEFILALRLVIIVHLRDASVLFYNSCWRWLIVSCFCIRRNFDSFALCSIHVTNFNRIWPAFESLIRLSWLLSSFLLWGRSLLRYLGWRFQIFAQEIVLLSI